MPRETKISAKLWSIIQKANDMDTGVRVAIRLKNDVTEGQKIELEGLGLKTEGVIGNIIFGFMSMGGIMSLDMEEYDYILDVNVSEKAVPLE